jgi:CBS domain containing-hemolysin-like protein
VPELLASSRGVLLAAALCAALSVLVTASAALLDRSGPIRLRHWVEKAGPRLRELFARPERFEAYRFLVSVMARLVAAVLLVLLVIVFHQVTESLWQAAVAACAVQLAVMLVAEGVSRRLAQRAEWALDALTGFHRFFLVLTWPLLPMAGALFKGAGTIPEDNGLEEDEASDDEIEAFLDVGAKEGILEPGEGDMIMRVIDFGDEVVRSVMTPRTEMVCAPAATPLEELATVFLDSSHSRIPLYGSSVDDIRGVLHIRDLLGALRRPTSISAEELALPPLFVPETKPLVELLRELQASHKHMALVVDEYGGTAGLVTIEDLLEEIVGEIIDEHDDESPEIVRMPDGSYRVDGRTSLGALERMFALDLDDEPYESVGGLVFGRVGDLPVEGSTLVTHGLRFTVEKVADRRVETVRVTVAGEVKVGGERERS